MKTEIEIKSHEEEDLDSSLYEEARSQMERIFQNIKEGLPFSMAPPSEIVSKFIDSLLVRDDLIRKALYSKAPALDFPSHLLNVCILSIEIGIGLRYLRDDLEKLGLAAILHDIGMVKIPEDILKKPGRLSHEEFDIVKKHPEYGTEILKGLGENSQWISEVILQEHERFDGKGYPKGLKGDEIHEYAVIIGIADVYEALTHHRFQRRNLPPFNSMKEILSVERSSFPKKIIKALLSKLPVFPVGTVVRLNSKEIGVVVFTDSLSPFRPTVEIIIDNNGRKPKVKKIVNLKENPLLYIISPVFEEEVHLLKK